MRLNSLLYRDRIAPKTLAAGALSAHTSYPATIALSRDAKKTTLIEKAAKKDAKTVIVNAENTQASALVKPRRIVKCREFVEQKGESEYYFM
jgi:16S rRNA G966 N2-methylase RsmD